MKSTLFTVLLGFVLAGLSACAGSVSYPSAEGAVEPSEPTTESVVTLMAEAIRFAHSRYGDDEAFAINLPPDTPLEVYDRVSAHLGAGYPMRDPAERAYHVTKVTVRGAEARVDLAYPRTDEFYEFVTITFRRDLLRGYQLANTRLWRTGDQPPPPSYVPQLGWPQSPVDEASEPQAASADDSDEL